MFDDLYNARILELAADIPRQGRLDAPDASASAHSKLCGSTVVVDLRIEDGRVADFAHEVKACALGQASSSIMARNVIGASLDELRAARDAVRAMLKSDAPPPEGRFAEAKVLQPVKDFKARHASTLLTFEATLEAAEKAAAKPEAKLVA
ncbi:MAG: iron-sulfur cluster assembly scaffold protein [Beijerinckiaceae bacterium]|nr:iron-sulfur cluster assembly scaffold protein [Beijerinckiaceae bacterium]